MSFSVIVGTARRIWGEPIEIMAAMGHGRSYGRDSMVWGRKISGIFPCALWQDLLARPPLPTTALVTDVGNDLLYDVPVDQLIEWVSGCLDRLAAVGAATIITELPLASVERLSDARFHLFRRLLFPRSRHSRNDVLAASRDLNARLIALGGSRNTSVIPVSGAWYGFDPIHLKRRVRHRAWPAMLASWRAPADALIEQRASLWMSAYLACLAPHERTWFGIKRCCAQPSGRMTDGSTISLY
jgi:hypothetical protein